MPCFCPGARLHEKSPGRLSKAHRVARLPHRRRRRARRVGASRAPAFGDDRTIRAARAAAHPPRIRAGARAAGAGRARSPALDAGNRHLRDAVPVDDRLSPRERGAPARGASAGPVRAGRVDPVVAAAAGDRALALATQCAIPRRLDGPGAGGVWPAGRRGGADLALHAKPRRGGQAPAARIGPQFLREVVRAAGAASRPAFLVPIAIFRGTGFHKRESRFATLLYSVQEAPGEAKRLFTYLWNAGQTQLTLGREISLHRFVDEHRREGEDRSARRLARVLQIVLYREERMVLGPTLLPRRVVREMVLRDPELVRLTRRLAAERGVPRRKVVKVARGYVDEMAAHFNGLYFGILEFVFNRIFPRVFSGLETVGLERVVECMREHPIVLVPCHRSHFDYLILTYIFHTNYLS